MVVVVVVVVRWSRTYWVGWPVPISCALFPATVAKSFPLQHPGRLCNWECGWASLWLNALCIVIWCHLVFASTKYIQFCIRIRNRQAVARQLLQNLQKTQRRAFVWNLSISLSAFLFAIRNTSALQGWIDSEKWSKGALLNWLMFRWFDAMKECIIFQKFFLHHDIVLCSSKAQLLKLKSKDSLRKCS